MRYINLLCTCLLKTHFLTTQIAWHSPPRLFFPAISLTIHLWNLRLPRFRLSTCSCKKSGDRDSTVGPQRVVVKVNRNDAIMTMILSTKETNSRRWTCPRWPSSSSYRSVAVCSGTNRRGLAVWWPFQRVRWGSEVDRTARSTTPSVCFLHTHKQRHQSQLIVPFVLSVFVWLCSFCSCIRASFTT